MKGLTCVSYLCWPRWCLLGGLQWITVFTRKRKSFLCDFPKWQKLDPCFWTEHKHTWKVTSLGKRKKARSREGKYFRIDLETSGLGGDFEVPLPERQAQQQRHESVGWSTFALIQHYSLARSPVPSHSSVPRHHVLPHTEPQQTRGDWAVLCPWLFWD